MSAAKSSEAATDKATAKARTRPVHGLPTAEPEEVGFSSERLARIAPAMQKYIDGRIAPGILSVIARHGKIVHFQTQGLMDLEAGKPVQDDTIYRIMSMTKPIVSVALMMLYEEGYFLLDEPISRYLPAFKEMKVSGKRGMPVPASREINFRDCLTHTAGFSGAEYMKIMARYATGKASPPLAPGKKGQINQTGRSCTLQEAFEAMSKAPLNFQPGTDWEYFAELPILGVLIEKISGLPLDRFLQERILDPLEMTDTHFYLPPEKVKRFAAGYTVNKNEWGELGLVDSPATSAKVLGPKTYFSPGGGLLSTAADYARFAQMLLNGGILDGNQIIGRKTLELMTTNHTGSLDIYAKGPGYGFGLGFFVRTSLAEAPLVGSLGAYGWGGVFCTSYFADPKEDMFGLMFSQILDSTPAKLPIRKDFERMVYQALVG